MVLSIRLHVTKSHKEQTGQLLAELSVKPTSFDDEGAQVSTPGSLKYQQIDIGAKTNEGKALTPTVWIRQYPDGRYTVHSDEIPFGEQWRQLVYQLRTMLPQHNTATPNGQGKLEPKKPMSIPDFIQGLFDAELGMRYATLPLATFPLSIFDTLPSIPPELRETIYKPDNSLKVEIGISAPSSYALQDFIQFSSQLSLDFQSQFAKYGHESDMDTAILLQWITTCISQVELSAHTLCLYQLSTILYNRFKRIRARQDFSSSIRLGQHNIQLCGPTHSKYTLLISTIASWLAEGFSEFGATGDVEDVFQWLWRTITPKLEAPETILSIINAYQCRANWLTDHEALNEVISLASRTLALSSLKKETQYNLLDALGGVLRMRYIILGDLTDLEGSIHAFQDALSLNKEHFEIFERWKLMVNLAGAMQYTNNPDEPVKLYRECLEACPAEAQYVILGLLAGSLIRRFNILHQEKDLEEAIQIQRQALAVIPPWESERRPYLLYNSALILTLRNKAEANDMGDAVRLLEESLALFGARPQRYVALKELGKTLIARFRASKAPEDVAGALRYLSQAVELTGSDDGRAYRSEVLSYLAQAYLERDSPCFDLSTGFTYLEACLDNPNSHAHHRLEHYEDALKTFWASTMSKYSELSSEEAQNEHLLAAQKKFVNLLPQAAYTGLNIDSRLRVLRIYEGTAAFAAYLFFNAHRIGEAVELIEAGRAIFWSQALDLRRIPEGVPRDLHERLQVAAGQLERDNFSSQPIQAQSGEYSHELDFVRRRRLNRDFEAIVKEIRAVPGCENFLLPEPFAVLEKVAIQGPVVILMSNDNRCFAVTLKHDSKRNITVTNSMRFRGVSQKMLLQLSFAFQQGNQRSASPMAGSEGPTESSGYIHESFDMGDLRNALDGAERAGRRSKSAPLPDRALLALWEMIVKPIFDLLELKPCAGDARPRLWWCPTGAFTFLPIHAAGAYLKGGECCANYVVSSYTPTLGSLLQARRSMRPIALEETKVLLAAVPNTNQGASPLRGTVTELENISAIIPSETRIQLPSADDVLVDSKAGMSVRTLIDNLPQTTILHLACHGKQDYNNPLNSAFLLRDRSLTMAELLPIPLPNAFLAFLSACETAKGDQERSDQTIHLASTMLFAGFKSIVATLWYMNDEDGPEVAKIVYERLFSGNQSTLDPYQIPYALDDARERLRAKGLPPSRWAPFIHIGV